MGGWTWYYALFNFAVLCTVLVLFGKKVVAKMFREHRERIADGLRHEQSADAELAEAMEEIQHADSDEESKISAIISAAQTEAEQCRHEDEMEDKQLEDSSQAQLEHIRARLVEAARHELDAEAAVDIVSRTRVILSRCTDAQKRRLNAGFIEELPRRVTVSVFDRERINCGAKMPVTVVSAIPLDDGEQKKLTALLGIIFSSAELSYNFHEDASLIGGIRLQVGDTVYDDTVENKLRLAEKAIEECDNSEGDPSEDIKALISAIDLEAEKYQVGRVENLLDGICHVSGLGDVMTGEMVEFKGDIRGMVMNLAPDNVGIVMLGDYSAVQEGEAVRRTGHIIEVPVGEALIGRVVDALGRPIDNDGDIHTTETRPIECSAPSVVNRKSVSVPLHTGIKAVDALIPIGRGQRELIIGDRQTGKTSIALGAIINQKGKDVICVYVAIGQKESTVARVVEKLREHGAMDYTIVVCANASDPAALLYIAPYAGCAIGEYFMYNGRDVLIVYDDLSKQAVAYREISLLLQRPPGREAYPGDIFYLHSRLLERAARLNEENGGGSMTALPIVETQAGNISAYIPTNVISITDGQLFLQTDLFNSGVRPAINVGLSVSRVGGSAQLGAMKQVAASLRLKLAQYRELEAFAQFGSEMDKSTRDTLHRGDRLTELLKQPLSAPMGAAEQVVAIFAVNEGYADSIELDDIRRFETELNAYAAAHWPELQKLILSGKKLTDEQLTRLRGMIEDFKTDF